MIKTKKMHSFRMHTQDIVELQRIAQDKQCSQIAILEQALHKLFDELRNEKQQSRSQIL